MGHRIGGSLRIFQVGDLVSGSFADHNDRYPGGSPKFKEMVGIVTQVEIEEGYGTYRVAILMNNKIGWAFDYSLTLVEAV